jgi:hypothetical protein
MEAFAFVTIEMMLGSPRSAGRRARSVVTTSPALASGPGGHALVVRTQQGNDNSMH